MFETDWANNNILTTIKQQPEGLPNWQKDITKAAPIVWKEHCLECAAPDCYGTCSLYRPRTDGLCRLLANGMLPRKDCNGTWGYGAEISFEGWAKIQAIYTPNLLALPFARTLNKLNVKAGKAILERLGRQGEQPSAFLFGAINEHDEAVSLILEVSTDTKIKFRTSIVCKNGYTQLRIPFKALSITADELHRITVYPEDTQGERSLIFFALDFVVERKGYIIPNIPESAKPLKPRKIKCLVWDLDNTLWHGVLIESDEVSLNPKAAELIKELDKRGIVNSIASKNDHEAAWKQVKAFGLDEYFVMPQISWNPKSQSLQGLASEMNIGIDTLAFIDDSSFERAEVASVCPEVLCIDTADMLHIPAMPEFDVVVTADSQKRRHTYKMLEKQNTEQKSWGDNIDGFLRSCQIRLTVGKPKKEELTRCFELLQRTNQLNASGRWLAMEDVSALWSSPDYETYVLICEDRFGSYGLVGFSSIRLGEEPCITDFVISCRVANKKVEHSFFKFLAARYRAKGCKNLWINYRKSAKNSAMFRAVAELGMVKGTGKALAEDIDSYCMSLKEEIIAEGVVSVKERED
ncbi:MAG: HAD-IIIC family phosphatase [Oscillospiraceae bacterium]|jgi:FkbH-like protein|nr:HAD-IIIC family phosphatase [Oscillospiraceae bacterium]